MFFLLVTQRFVQNYGSCEWITCSHLRFLHKWFQITWPFMVTHRCWQWKHFNITICVESDAIDYVVVQIFEQFINFTSHFMVTPFKMRFDWLGLVMESDPATPVTLRIFIANRKRNTWDVLSLWKDRLESVMTSMYVRNFATGLIAS